MSGLSATYRLQFHAGFRLADALTLVPYLDRLGVSHLHCSPLLAARRGSTHGYDVVDPDRINPEIGTEDDLRRLVEALRARGMGLLLDIVPNHMAASPENWRWEDVLRHGRASAFATWFDIEWRAGGREQQQRMLLPVLGDLRVHVLARGEIVLAFENDSARIRYFEHSLPLDPATLSPLLLAAAARMETHASPGLAEKLRGLAARAHALPARASADREALARRRAGAEEIADGLQAIRRASAEARESLDTAAARFGRADGRPARLRRLLDAQPFRLVYWRRAAREINYRRFFDVNELVALHAEDPDVFAATHARVLAWRREGLVDGFRIDHPDGLLDPAQYLQRLADTAFAGAVEPPILVEKILAPGERLPPWPVSGTTGYEFMNEVESLFIDPAGYGRIEDTYRRLLRRPLEFAGVARLAKRRVLEGNLAAGVRAVAHRLLRLVRGSIPVPFSLHTLMRAIVETIVYLPVYRTYVSSRQPEPGASERVYLEAAIEDARRNRRADGRALDALAEALLALPGPLRSKALEPARIRFVQRFQQLSGPAAAKGIEDTALYSYVPLASRNEVGGTPEVGLAEAIARFHTANIARARDWPCTGLNVTTHDTKRSADVRARLDVLSEMPDEWERAVMRWRRETRSHTTLVEGRRFPDAGTIHLVLQVLVGTWPPDLEPADGEAFAAFRSRLVEYALKAAREAKVHTSWVEPDGEFEEALARYVESILTPSLSGAFLADLRRFVARCDVPGTWNALARTLLLAVSPGVPEIYQGDELWLRVLVDPDNRRPVDFGERHRLVNELDRIEASEPGPHGHLATLLERPDDGAVKLYVIRRLLGLRRAAPAVFARGSWEPLAVSGVRRGHVVAFARREGEQTFVGLVGLRMVDAFSADRAGPRGPEAEWWGDTSIAVPAGLWPGSWRCAVGGTEVRPDGSRLLLSAALAAAPIALLQPQAGRA